MKTRSRLTGSVATALVVSLGMGIAGFAGAGNVRADWAKTQDNTGLCTSLISAPVEPETYDSPWTGDYVYFGWSTQSYDAWKYRVLAPRTTEYGGTTMLLDSDEIMYSDVYDSGTDASNVWATSDICDTLNGWFYENCFTDTERSAIAESYTTDGLAYEEWSYMWVKFSKPVPLTGDHIFLLDALDISNPAYGYSDNYGHYSDDYGNWIWSNNVHNHTKDGSSSGGWWIRSADVDYYAEYYEYYNYYPAGIMDHNGLFSTQKIDVTCGIAPALNIDLNAVIFSSLVEGNSVGDKAYKLTLLDPDLSIALTEGQNVSISGSNITIPYTVSGTHATNADRISVLILDNTYTPANTNNASIKYYGELDENGQFTLPADLALGGWGSDYYIYIIAEDVNGQTETDYSSEPFMVYPPSFTIGVSDDGNGTASASAGSALIGAEITLTATPNEGYQFKEWQVTSGGITITNNTFTVGTSDIFIIAIFEPAPEQGGGASSQGGGSSSEPTTAPEDTPSGSGPSSETTPTPAVPTDVPSDPTAESGVAGFVERLYTVALGRSSDPVGKQDWIDAITLRGETGASAARGFLYSPEFLNNECTNEDFVAVLYRTFFDREPDQAGFNAWIRVLNEGTPKEEVIEGFINSTEWANLCLRYGIRSGGTGTPNIDVEPNQATIEFATRLYTTCLGRDADEAGMMAWARQLANQRDSGTGAARGFFFSYEFTGQNVSNAEFVNRLYRTFMGREADEAGFSAWVAQLDSGVSREEVFNGFAESPEFTRICASYGIVR